MANRGNVKYTEAVNITAGSDTECDVIKNMCNIIKLNLQESIGYNNVKDNPNDYPNKKYRTVTSGYESKLDAIANANVKDTYLTASTINNMLKYEDVMLNNIGKTKMNANINSGDDATVNIINKAAANLRAASTFFDNVNSYWDSSNYCKLSCQVACQLACQLACQSCQYNTCHNQNCGGWS